MDVTHTTNAIMPYPCATSTRTHLPYHSILHPVFLARLQFEPFGDPYDRKRSHQKEKRNNAPALPNSPGIPPGSYQGSCTGCAVQDAGSMLVCTQCVDGFRERHESSIAVDACAADEQIGNSGGKLICEVLPGNLLPRGGEPGDGEEEGGEGAEGGASSRAAASANYNPHGPIPSGSYHGSCVGEFGVQSVEVNEVLLTMLMRWKGHDSPYRGVFI